MHPTGKMFSKIEPKCGCRHCMAMKMHRGRGHPNWEIMFWQSIYSTGKFERSPDWRDRDFKNIEDITQFEVGMNNRKYLNRKKII